MKCSWKSGQSVQHQPHRERNTHKHSDTLTHTQRYQQLCVCVCVQSQLNKSTEVMKKCRCFFLILIGLLCIANRLYKEMLQQRDILLLLLLLPRATQTWQYILIKPSKEEEETCHAHVIWSMPCGKRNANEASKAKRKTALTVLCVCSCSLFLSHSLPPPSPPLLFSLPALPLPSHFCFFFPCPTSPPRQHIKFSITNF